MRAAPARICDVGKRLGDIHAGRCWRRVRVLPAIALAPFSLE